MDPPANHQNPIDIDWFHYFDQHNPPLFRGDTLDQNVWTLRRDENIISRNGFQYFDNSLEDLSLWDSCWGDYSPSSGADVTTDHLGFQDFDPTEDLSLWDYCWDNIGLPLLSFNDQSSECGGEAGTCSSGAAAAADHGGRRKVAKKPTGPLELEEIERCFEMPIVMAAKELGTGVTCLKKRCRELNIKRWPHRKLKSLQSLIQNVKELGLEEEIEMLTGHKRMMEKSPDMNITERTKKLRQACFKATYKKRRLNSSP